jgi:hypothetical protein
LVGGCGQSRHAAGLAANRVRLAGVRRAAVLWEAHEKAVGGNTSGNSRQNTPDATAEQPNASVDV